MDVDYHTGAAITMIVLNGISCLSLIFVITIYALAWKKIASFPMRISFYLCVACLVQNLNVLIYNPVLVHSLNNSNNAFCTIEATLKAASDMSSIIWTALIIYSTYASVVNSVSLQRMETIYLVLGFGVPFALAIIPACVGLYGPNVYYCWFDSTDLTLQFTLKIVYFFGPLWVSFGLDFFWAISTYQQLKKVGLGKKELLIFQRVLLFPLILLVTGLFATVDVIYNYISDEKFVAWLDIIAISFLSCYGLANSIAYGFNPLIRDHILTIFGMKEEPLLRQSSTQSDLSRRTERLSELMMF